MKKALKELLGILISAGYIILSGLGLVYIWMIDGVPVPLKYVATIIFLIIFIGVAILLEKILRRVFYG